MFRLKFFDKLRWLSGVSTFRRSPLRVTWNALVWECCRFWNHEIPFLFDDTFTIQLRPNEGVSRLTFYFGTSEPDLFSFYNAFFKDGMVVIDAGANIGLHTLFIAKRVAPSGKVFSFEASPKNFARLVENAARSSLKNISTYPVALGDSRGVVFIHENPGDSSRSRISEANSGISVKMVRLDDFCREASLTSVDFLKLDVEGCEMRVLQGAESLFSKGLCRVLQIEFDPSNLASQATREITIRAWLLDRGYCPVYWNQSSGRFFPTPLNGHRFYNSFFVCPGFEI